jgi:hypothetical protein
MVWETSDLGWSFQRGSIGLVMFIHNEADSGIDNLPRTYTVFHKISTSMEHLSGGT